MSTDCSSCGGIFKYGINLCLSERVWIFHIYGQVFLHFTSCVKVMLYSRVGMSIPCSCLETMNELYYFCSYLCHCFTMYPNTSLSRPKSCPLSNSNLRSLRNTKHLSKHLWLGSNLRSTWIWGTLCIHCIPPPSLPHFLFLLCLSIAGSETICCCWEKLHQNYWCIVDFHKKPLFVVHVGIPHSTKLRKCLIRVKKKCLQILTVM